MNPSETRLAWGNDTLAPGQWHQLDQLWLLFSPAKHELGISHCYGEPGRAGWLQFSGLSEIRYPLAGDLQITQKLSTRPVVARPNRPVYLPAGEKVTLFVGTSLWFCLSRDKDVLLDLPVTRLSDTWFGADTRVGEVCYACPTHARLSMDGVPANPWKAITPVEIRNEDSSMLVIDRVNLPVPHLGLYRDENRYWTSEVTITRKSADVAGEVRISTEAPSCCRSPAALTTPRKKLEGGMVHKAMGLLLG